MAILIIIAAISLVAVLLMFKVTAYKIGFFLLCPELILLSFAVLWGVGKYMGWDRLRKSILVFGASFLILITVIPAPQWGLAWLENQYRSVTIPENAKGIIFLGGSFDLRLTKELRIPCYNQAGGRILDTFALIRKYPNMEIVFTGGGVVPGVSEADMLKHLMSDLNIPHEKVIFESESRNTEENAALTKKMIRPSPDDVWVLVTSAYHMPRSVQVFKKHGWNVAPYPVDFHSDGKIQWIKFPQFEKDFLAYKVVVRELLGMLAARLS